jgi:hypothetical protein
MNKTENFPSVNYTSLRESSDRREFMAAQLDKYGIAKSSCYQTERFSEIKDHIKYYGKFAHEVTQQLGCIISHLNLMRNWYNSTNEPYAIFCEDDASFESIDYWSFTWNDFMQNLPQDWQCVQLVRMISPFTADTEVLSKIDLRMGRWWGSHSLMTRSYVEQILKKTCIGFNEYHIYVDEVHTPFIENILYLDMGPIYNIPMVVESADFGTVYLDKEQLADRSQIESHEVVRELWRTTGPNLSIQEIMNGN